VAAQLASKVTPARLILESAFSSARDVAKAAFPWLAWAVILRYDFDTQRHVSAVDCPVLVLHSRADEMVPFDLGRKIYQAARPPKAFHELSGGHNGGFMLSQPAYERRLRDFIEGVRASADPSS
jgi:fermentation-respiration switch protein FrsA (DUF1100 family)